MNGIRAIGARRTRVALLLGSGLATLPLVAAAQAQTVPSSSAAQVDPPAPGAPPQSAPATAEQASRENAAQSAGNATTQTVSTGAGETSGDIVVTGSRVVRDGYSAPTPLTVVGSEQIAKAAPANIADYINQLPQLQPSSTPRVGAGTTSLGTAGLNLLDLRGLGPTRTLVLLDGRRVVASTQTGSVDVNNLPSTLVQRVEVVTGGASAAYGSDAVAGVVNFIVDSKFTGLKVSVQGGETDRRDDGQITASAAVGYSFAGDRGHLLASAEYSYEEGIDYLDPAKRQWYNATYIINNPAYAPGNGQPVRLIRSNVNYSTVAQGGVINYGLTAAGTRVASVGGVQFGTGGAVQPFAYGLVAGTFMVGGNTWNEGNVVALTPELHRGSVWSRGTYEFSPAARLTLEGSYGASSSRNSAGYQRYVGNLTISSANPFIPLAERNALAAAGATSFNYGYSSYDLGRPVNDISRETWRVVAGLDGGLFGSFRYNAYYQHGETDLSVKLLNTTNVANFALAIDAVTNPATGQIVCRSTLANPANGCVPLNIFGIGVASPAAIAYVKGIASQHQTLKQDVAAVSFTGEPFDLWAGPVSLAFGAEHRREAANAVGDPISVLNGFYTGNFKSNAGSYDVNEGFAEVVVPLAKDAPFFKLVELNAAGRVTGYSTSGIVATWKAGLTYSPVSDLRLRVVRSRDIRAPNLSELYIAGATQALDVNDPFNGNALIRHTRVTNGNPNLAPEKADTFSVGAVVNPSFLHQLGLSVDYYTIKVGGAITALTDQQIVNRCYAGETALCQYITRNAAGTITSILALPLNLAEVKERGLDVDVSFRQPLDALAANLPGTVTLRFLATKVFTYTTTNAGIVDESVGENGGPLASIPIPRLRTYTTLGYDNDRFSLTGTMRTVSSGVYDVTWKSGVDIDNNHIDGATYFDLAGSVRFARRGTSYVEAFFKIDNLLDKDPPVAAGNSASTLQTNPILYDVLGRSYRGGVRFRF